jgi:hypothetical protein
MDGAITSIWPDETERGLVRYNQLCKTELDTAPRTAEQKLMRPFTRDLQQLIQNQNRKKPSAVLEYTSTLPIFQQVYQL